MDSLNKNYKYDIAISLCKQDVEFARKLVKALNPSLEIFFYEDKQTELITKSGAEAFGKVFKDEARIVVILSRNDWSESFYTEIERNSIIDRTAIKNQGYQFLIVIPMEQGEIPAWYPSTKIYTNPRRFTIEDLAKFIEFKVSDEGGLVKQLTFEDKYQHLLDKIDEKKKLIRLQETKEAVERGKSELALLKKRFNEKSQHLTKSNNFNLPINHNMLFPQQFQGKYSYSAYSCISDFVLGCGLSAYNEPNLRLATTQDLEVIFKISKIYGANIQKTIIESESLRFYYSTNRVGWAKRFLYEQATENETAVLFRNREGDQYYELVEIVSTEDLVDIWYKTFLEYATNNLNRYL